MPDSPFEDLARAALLEITPAATIGAYAGQVDEGNGAVSVLFDSAMPGYPDWKWTVSLAQVEGSEPTVLEAELMPAEGALLAPDWVPWSDRLAEYKAAQEAADGVASDGDASDDDDDPDEDADVEDEDSDDEDDDLDDDDELDEDDVLGNDVLHGGDLDGVEIDALDPDSEDSDDDSDDSDDEQEKSY